MGRENKCLVLFSGGLDSMILLYRMRADPRFSSVEALFFVYPSAQNTSERSVVTSFCKEKDIILHEVDLTGIFKQMHGGSAMFSPSGTPIKGVPFDDYIIPFRNGIFISVAAGFAESRGFSTISTGVHAGYGVTFPDCTYSYTNKQAECVREGTNGGVTLFTPYVYMRKKEILSDAILYDVPVARSLTCYSGLPTGEHCGECRACMNRRKAFTEAGITDPTTYTKRLPYEELLEELRRVDGEES